METRDKYYTPCLSELRLGLEYEEYQGCDNWENNVLTSIDDLDWLFDQCTHVKDDCLSKVVRIFYITHEQLVSDLKFKYLGENEYSISKFRIQFKEDKHWFIITDDTIGVRYSGRLKNKLEVTEMLNKLCK